MTMGTVNRWPIVLFSIPFAAVLFGIVMVSTAIYFPDDVVIDDYYQDGKAINQQIHADEKASELDISAQIEKDASGLFRVLIKNARDSAVQLSLRHVTDQGQDMTYTLVPDEGAEYVGETRLAEVLNSKGIWYLEIRGLDDGWRLRQRLVVPLTSVTVTADE